MASDSEVERFECTAQGIGIMGDTKVQIKDSEWTLQLDEPESDGGTNKGANPMQWVPCAHLCPPVPTCAHCIVTWSVLDPFVQVSDPPALCVSSTVTNANATVLRC